MRKIVCVLICLLCLSGCGGTPPEEETEDLRAPYQNMTGCQMEGEVTCGIGSPDVLTYTLSCTYDPEGESVVQVLAPETAAGVEAVLTGETLALRYADSCLDAGTFHGISPAACFPRLADALHSGWLLEQNVESVDGEDCLRLCLDQSTSDGGKVLSTVWLRLSDGLPVQGTIGVEDEIILSAVFTHFEFCDTMDSSSPDADGSPSEQPDVS